MASDDWAVIIGINHYPDLGDLLGPENDAKAFFQWVNSKDGGDVPASQIRLVLSSNYTGPFDPGKARPTVADVEDHFIDLDVLAQNISAAGKGLKVGRRLYLYFSGHGCAPVFDEAALLMANATRGRLFHIPGRLWANWFYQAGYFEEVVLLMDCSRERYPRVALNVPPFIDVMSPDAVRGKRFYGFAAKWSGMSRERSMPDGKVHGAFSAALLEGLRGAASEPNGEITAVSLANYLYGNMKTFLAPEASSDPSISLEPDLVFDAKDRFVLARVPSEAIPTYSVTIELPDESKGRSVQILDSSFQRIAESQSGTSETWQLNLRRGIYLVRIEGLEWNRIFEVRGTGGVHVSR